MRRDSMSSSDAALHTVLDDSLRRRLELRVGVRGDYRRLARFHYHAALPATAAEILTLAERATGEPIGVLIVSMPTLNGAWRRIAWPEDAGAGGVCERWREGKRGRGAALNATTRAISRVVVDPRWRVRGVATALVRAYLAAPLTARTEAVAAMGECCRFFARAGMRPIRVPASGRDRRLAEALEAARVAPWVLADAARVQRRLGGAPELHRALRTWANDSRATRQLLLRSPSELALRAARALTTARLVYVSG